MQKLASTAVGGNTARLRKNVLMKDSVRLLEQRVLLLVQCNNMLSRDLDELRFALSRHKIGMRQLNTSIFKKALQQTLFRQMEAALAGPVVAWFTDIEPGEAGRALLAATAKTPNVHLLAGKIDGHVWTHEGCADILQRLPKTADLQAQLLSLLQTPATGLASLLAQPSNTLGVALTLHVKSASDASLPPS